MFTSKHPIRAESFGNARGYLAENLLDGCYYGYLQAGMILENGDLPRKF
jgi:hypothetical protein